MGLSIRPNIICLAVGGAMVILGMIFDWSPIVIAVGMFLVFFGLWLSMAVWSKGLEKKKYAEEKDEEARKKWIKIDTSIKMHKEKHRSEEPVLLGKESTEPVSSEIKDRSDETVCPHCKKFLGYGDRDFCPHCGKKIDDRLL